MTRSAVITRFQTLMELVSPGKVSLAEVEFGKLYHYRDTLLLDTGCRPSYDQVPDRELTQST